MPAVQVKRHEQILESVLGRVVARSALSDVSDTSQFKTLAAGVSRDVDEVYYQFTRMRDLFNLRRARGADLDARAAEIQPGTLRRIRSRRAVGTVVFSRTLSSGTVTIRSGTIVKTASGVVFRTTIQAQIVDATTSSPPVSVIADEAGTEGNVAAGEIVRFGSKIPGVDAVANASPTLRGRAEESDDLFRERVLNFIAALSRCTVEALEFLAVGVEDPNTGKVVEFAKVIEDLVDRGNSTLYIDDGAGTAADLGTPVVGEVVIASAVGGEEFLRLQQSPVDDTGASALAVTSSTRGALVRGTTYFLNPTNGRIKFVPPLAVGEQVTADYTPFINLVALVQKLVEGDPLDRLNFPGYRAAGTRVVVAVPSIVSIPVEASLTVDGDAAAIAAEAVSQVLEYVNNVGISGDIIRNRIIEVIMSVQGVTDVDLTVPPDNIVVLDDQLPRSMASVVNIT